MIDFEDLERVAPDTPEVRLWRSVASFLLYDAKNTFEMIARQIELSGAASIYCKRTIESLLRETDGPEFELICEHANLHPQWFQKYIGEQMAKLNWNHVRFVRHFNGDYRQ